MIAPLLAALTAAVVVGDHGSALPFFTIHALDIGPLPLQPFGIIVAAGVLIGAEVQRRYALRFGMDEDDIRGLTLWLIAAGFVGAHVFDAVVYEHERLADDPLLILKIWDGISSYGGFIGGTLGYAIFVWWKRLVPRIAADVSLVGLLVAFSIGRIGCTIVHDHIGRATTSSFGVDYPRAEIVARRLISEFPDSGSVIRAHNVAMYELVYLALVCAIIIPLAFSKRRYPAGLLAVFGGLFYAPVRFFLEYWRLNASDPRYMGLTFAQWSSLVFFVAAGYVAIKLWRTGWPAPLADELAGRPGGREVTMEQLKKARAAGIPLTKVVLGKDGKEVKQVRDTKPAKAAAADAKADDAKDDGAETVDLKGRKP